MTREEIQQKAEALGSWYHEIELCPGYKTISHMVGPSGRYWQMIAEVRKGISYVDKTVLDLGTMTGMWAFGAEQLGARIVVAADIWQACNQNVMEQFLFAKQVLSSLVFPITNGDVHCLRERLQGTMELLKIPGFDIIQCLGLLYHVENPLLALRQIRNCLQAGGVMLLETAVWVGHEHNIMRFNSDNGVYVDPTTFWVPTLDCLEAMLWQTGFAIAEDTVTKKSDPDNDKSYRVCAICRAA